MPRKGMSLTDYAEAKGRAVERPAPPPPVKPGSNPAPKPKPVPEEEPKPKVLNEADEKRAKLLETLAKARAVRQERLAAKASLSSRKGGSATSPASAPPPTQPDKEPEVGELLPTVYVPLPHHLQETLDTAFGVLKGSKFTPVIVLIPTEQ